MLPMSKVGRALSNLCDNLSETFIIMNRAYSRSTFHDIFLEKECMIMHGIP